MGKPDVGVDWAEKMTDVLAKCGGTATAAPPEKGAANTPVDAPTGGTGAPSGIGGPSGGNGAGKPTAPADAAPGTNGTGKCVDGPGKKPAGGGGGGGGGKPAGGGGGKPATGGGGGKPAGGKTAGDPGAGGKPAGDPSGGTKPADAPIPPALAGKSAKECADFAKSALAKLEGLEAQSKTIAAASANFVTDAQAGKKAAEDAQKQSDEAEKAMPPVPTIASPTGSTDSEKYESAMKIRSAPTRTRFPPTPTSRRKQ
jgi:hypothetical protein